MKIIITEPIYVRNCRECPYGKWTWRAFAKLRCDQTEKYLTHSDPPLPDWCPLENVPDEDEKS